MNSRFFCAIAIGLCTAGPAWADSSNDARDGSELRRVAGAVFTTTNEAGGNRVAAFERHRDGSLGEPEYYATDGTGTGDSLGSQGALVLTRDHRFLLVVNAGSNELSSFAVHGSELELRDRVSSGGTRPISVDERGGVAYVLNAGGSGNISGFRLTRAGALEPIEGSTQALSGSAVNPAQIAIHPELATVVVTEKATSAIDVFDLDPFARARPLERFASAGQTPFGFAFTSRGVMVVSEAGTRSASSYAFTRGGDLRLVTPAVGDTQAAPCWVAISADDRFAFVANAGSGSISSYSVDRSGKIALTDARGGEAGAGSAPLDMSVDGSGKHLYLLDRGNARVSAFDIGTHGELEMSDVAGKLPPFATGVASF
jgi:6-phosphogluconolactonase (cycloisomerase 2 family)